MNPTTTTGNDRLPFDVLTEIFPYYASQETPQYPTETLLLVCKSWHVAALAKHSVWSQFRIHIGHHARYNMLPNRTKTRLKRSGDVSPLDIELRNLVNADAPNFTEDFEDRILDTPPTVICTARFDQTGKETLSCNCEVFAYEHIIHQLYILAGLYGHYCRRWRSLLLVPSSLDFLEEQKLTDGDERLAYVLSYPTPKLVSLSIHHFIDADIPRFPLFLHTPVLTHLALDNCLIDILPNAEKLEFLGVSWTHHLAIDHWDRNGVWHRRDQEGVWQYTSMRCLKILKLNLPMRTLLRPSELPELRTLVLRGSRFPLEKEDMSASIPHLSHLSLGIGNMMLPFSLETTIPESLKRVKTLNVWYNGPFPSAWSLEQMPIHLVEVLRLTYSLESLEGDARMLGVVLKLIADPPEPASDSRILGNQEVIFRVNPGGSSWKLDPSSVREDVIELANRLEVMSPDNSWKSILREMELEIVPA
ncbi:hypothetical protein M408DRAFT_25088 [Serendipita vermifera MAFF 305830]|uniref:F-box domain-containing protein n=1 Tax=Serendipita vermifera MAFF 305830 TaxID=933852 RepID=A0A0C2WKF0_SERVB|nr:hypothetical protein M408DRAFT_25088 [Serendipita vermifera MAFF 305830]